MKRLRVAVVGFGNLGQACGTAVLDATDLELAGLVRRPETAGTAVPKPFRDVPTVAHISELRDVDVALVCVPTAVALGVMMELLQHRTSLVECASLEHAEFHAHRSDIDRLARHRRVAAVIGAGWNPGIVTRLQDLFEILIPRGHTTLTRRPAVSLHHTAAAANLRGVTAALCSESRGTDGKPQRYVYVELKAGTDFDGIQRAICADPLFLGETTQVFSVESITALEQENHGILLERRGTAGAEVHDTVLLEARYAPTAFTARIMLNAARRIATYGIGAQVYSLYP